MEKQTSITSSLLPLKGVGGSLKQALAMMREEKLFSAIHITGTAMAIAFTMVMAVVYYIKLAPIYPEVNRPRTIYFEGIRIEAENHGMGMTSFSGKAFEDWFQKSKNIEYCSPTLLAAGTGKLLGRSRACAVRGKDDFLEVTPNEVSADYFKIYEYDFLEGRPFTSKEVEGREEVCVISDAFAERYFGKGKKAVGRMVEIENRGDVRVVGMVRSASQLTPDSYADIITPYSLISFDAEYQGMYSIVATVRDNEQLQALKQELDELAARLQQSHPEKLPHFGFGEGVKSKMVLTRNLETHPMHVLQTENRAGVFGELSVWELVRHYAGILFVLLFVPALNLCGIVAGRMERRSAEMAVRKTFGARRSTLLNQVVIENLVQTTIGGLIGLALAWTAIYALRREILGMFFDNSTLATAPIVEGEMLFAPTLFVGAFAAIILLNMLATVVPAWWSLRKQIVESMMEKR
ncbi:MAG: ABC transporter permease [Bacteroidaceae bacterium]|nr:ABC transporter permease [Bacteroidaceae bacterium]